MANLVVRTAVLADLPVILELYRHLALPAYGQDKEMEPREAERLFCEIAADPRQHLLVAEVAGRVMGTVLLEVYPNLTHGGQPSGVIENMVVLPEERRRGVGAALLREVDRLAREHRCYKLSLTSHQDRPQAHAFYQRMGWQRSHEGYTLRYDTMTEKQVGPKVSDG